MIKLLDLLLEAANRPKAIFLAGPAGSGKSYTAKQIIPSDLKIINVDDTYEELLQAAGLGTKIANFSQDQLSQAAKLMGQAQKTTKEKFAQLSADKNNIVIDRNFRVLNFYPDGYCKETNTIYEVYEPHHKSAKYVEKDNIRQRIIQDYLKCNFCIIWDTKNREIEMYNYV